MRIRARLITGSLLLLLCCCVGRAQVSTDQYGGVMAAASPNGGTGYYRVEKLNNRWLMVSPEGHYLWSIGVFTVYSPTSIDDLGSSYDQRILIKYGSYAAWAKQTVTRLHAWGFNTIGEYSETNVLPFRCPVKMGYVRTIDPSYYSLRNANNLASAPVKDLINGVSPLYKDYRGGTTPDVYDPNYAVYVDQEVSAISAQQGAWLMGVATDDADGLYGFGPGPDVKVNGIHAHIGWIILTGQFSQASNATLKLTYSDTKVYSKYALADFLAAKYGTIDALNAAWGSNYTTFGTAGGYGVGTGLLDENGQNSWVGTDWLALSTASPTVKADLDAFLYNYAVQYFSIVTSSIRKYFPHTLVFGPATLNQHSGVTRQQILKAAGQYLDVIQASVHSQQVLDLTAAYAGDVPLVSWKGIEANPDSDLWRYANPSGMPTTQSSRGTAYNQSVLADYNWTVSATGVHPMIGMKWWQWVDSWGHKLNFGLVSFSDNAYDGKEAIVAKGVDPWGYPTGGEERNYGNFIGSVLATNRQIASMVQALGTAPVSTDYSLSVSNATQTVYAGVSQASYNGTALAVNGFSSSVGLSCTSANTAPPATCNAAPTSVTPSSAGASFTLAATNPAVGDFNFNVQGVGTDSNNTTHTTRVTLHVVDFAIAGPASPINVERSGIASALISVTPFGSFTDSITLSCVGPLPTGITCSNFSLNNFVPASSGTNSTLMITASTAAALGSAVIQVNATGSSAGAPTKSTVLNLNIVPGLGFVPVTPCRIADTRQPVGPFGGPALLANAAARSFDIVGSACGIPSTALAYSLNITVVPHAVLGFLTAFPCGQGRPLTSNLNSLDRRVKAVAAIVPAGTSGTVCFFANAKTDLILDINGYFVPSNDSSNPLAFFPLTPCRLVDTRQASGPLGGPYLAANTARDFPLQSSTNCNIPAAAQAYSLNYTAVPKKGGLGYLTTWPAGESQPLVSTLNALTGAVTANAAIVPAGTNGDVNVFVSNDADVVIDINGYFAPPGSAANPLSFYTLPPCRVLDTRHSTGSFTGELDASIASATCNAPAAAQAYVLNATVVPQHGLGYLTLWPQGAAQPTVSTLNALDGSITSNLALVPTSNGSISAAAPNPTQLVLDISGYFGP